MAKVKTAGDVFEKWRAVQGIETKAEFAEQFGMSRQQYNNILNGSYVSSKELANLAIDHRGTWLAECAAEVMRFQGDEELVPCVCLMYIGDNGPCPRHGVGLGVRCQGSGVKVQAEAA